MSILVIDVGGSHVKIRLNARGEERKAVSGPDMSAQAMVETVKRLAEGWAYDVVAIGFPGPVLHGRPLHEPANLGEGWVGFDYTAALGCPVRLVNDAAMQALGSYCGGKMLFLGLGTGLGSAMIVDDVIEPMELAHLPYRKHTFEYYVGERALERRGKKKWRKSVFDVITRLQVALEPDYVVVGGGNVRHLKELPAGVRKGENSNAFIGGVRLWQKSLPAAGTGVAATDV